MDATRSALFALGAAALFAACNRDEVTHVRVPKIAEAPQEAPAAAGANERQAPPAGPMGAPMAGPMGGPMAGQVAPPPPPDAAATLQWKLPAGWTEKKEGGMRFATLRAAAPSKVDVSVVVLPGSVAGELANVNRWRGQLGLGPIDEAQRAAARKAVASKAGELSLYELASEDAKSRMVAAMLSTDAGSTWFVKMTGSAEDVAARQSEFLRLLASLQFAGAATSQR